MTDRDPLLRRDPFDLTQGRLEQGSKGEPSLPFEGLTVRPRAHGRVGGPSGPVDGRMTDNVESLNLFYVTLLPNHRLANWSRDHSSLGPHGRARHYGRGFSR